MSEVKGLDTLRSRLTLFDKNVTELVDAQMKVEFLRAQREAAELVPVDSGKGRDTVMLPEAVSRDVSANVSGSRWRFGFLTKTMQRAAFYLFFVEFGTKGYTRGELRFAGYDKRGRRRRKKIKRAVPARPAQPWFRPAAAHLVERVRQKQAFAGAISAARVLCGLRGGQG